MNREILKYLIVGFHERPVPQVIDRDLDLPTESGKIIALVGIRRSGKTYLMFQTIHKLLISGVEKENILYLNFEDDRLFPIHPEEMDLILRSYHELYPDRINQKKYLFFDEIQNGEGWERYCRRIYDQENISLFLSGSSSRFLSADISTALRGRTLSYKVYPLSFSEFLRFQSIPVKAYSEQSRAAVENAFDQYMRIGGFPEVVTAQESLRSRILQEYADLLLYKDLIEHYGIKNQYLLKMLLKYCFSNPATLLSTHKLFRDLKSQGLALSKNTLYEYIETLEYAFILFTTEIYNRSIRKQMQNPKKLYIIDTGLVSRFIPNPFIDLGKKFENIVFLTLLQREFPITYYRDNVEIDFVVEHESSPIFINVCYQWTHPRTLEREIRALAHVHEQYPKAKKLLLSRGDPKPALPPFIEWMDGVEFVTGDVFESFS